MFFRIDLDVFLPNSVKKNSKIQKQNFFNFSTFGGGRPPNFGGHFLGAEMEIQKSHRGGKLYCPKEQYDTPYN